MANSNRSDYQTQVDNLIPDNTNEEITPADVRQILKDQSDSGVSRVDDPYFKFLGSTGGISTALSLTSANDYPASSYDTSIPFIFQMSLNSGASPTLNINSIGALNIYDDQENQITDAENLVSGRYYAAIYSADADGAGTEGIVIILRFGSSVVETGVRTNSTSYTIGSPGTYVFDGSSLASWTLPAGSSSNQWSKFYIANVGSANISLDGDGTDPISGTDPFIIYPNTGLKTCVWDGETWIISN